jgi:hypothetical protein
MLYLVALLRRRQTSLFLLFCGGVHGATPLENVGKEKFQITANRYGRRGLTCAT